MRRGTCTLPPCIRQADVPDPGANERRSLKGRDTLETGTFSEKAKGWFNQIAFLTLGNK